MKLVVCKNAVANTPHYGTRPSYLRILRLQLKGAARKTWLKKTRARLDELQEQLSLFANAKEIP